ADHLAAPGASGMVLNFGLFFVVVGLAFKVGAVPFHFWKPDVYQGSPTLVTTFMATVVMMGGIAGFFRFIDSTGMPDSLARSMVLLTLATLLVGNVSALRQTNFKRLMAYSSVSHSGFLLLALLTDSGLHEGHGSAVGGTLFYYTFTYSLATTGLFILFTIAKRANAGAEHNGIFKGLWHANTPRWRGHTPVGHAALLGGHPAHGGLHRQVPGVPAGHRRGLAEGDGLRRTDGLAGHLLLHHGGARGVLARRGVRCLRGVTPQLGG
ncbi:MAG TPA: proton-conducting transporter membrane subunit, partial [Flavobacteriales bacterium]|nr:proton-conducting transporter membrane subunit [Flavobacteriales bacterium]